MLAGWPDGRDDPNGHANRHRVPFGVLDLGQVGGRFLGCPDAAEPVALFGLCAFGFEVAGLAAAEAAGRSVVIHRFSRVARAYVINGCGFP